ncbi:hypothetical protein [Sphingosinicella sp. BN140058]|uniref:hypothetical protein n=1 Tax=Sphingosinicella sp. BN140058 TaxID=1892855 RepID=UPI001012CE43|nr:hypothetical protein [Sphingosinicella sp. BN140058]QAY75106.1 hypothetical protein ETR14_00090 [Sphingosinicella sp. BN140058]
MILGAALGCMLASANGLAAEVNTDRLAPLRALVGEWRGESSAGRTLRISYRLIANDTVLVESWRSPSGRETMTVYHQDGSDLVATHYCAQGNQPRLRLGADRRDHRWHFFFRDATNLSTPRASHLHEFWIEPLDAGTMRRSETYTADGERSEESAVLKRIVPDPGA